MACSQAGRNRTSDMGCPLVEVMRRQVSGPVPHNGLRESLVMPRIDVPADKDPLVFLWTERAQALTSTGAAFSDAVYKRSSLPLREFEAARTRIAQINDCAICLDWRTARDVKGWSDDPDAVPDEFYANVGLEWEGFSGRERLAA